MEHHKDIIKTRTLTPQNKNLIIVQKDISIHQIDKIKQSISENTFLMCIDSAITYFEVADFHCTLDDALSIVLKNGFNVVLTTHNLCWDLSDMFTEHNINILQIDTLSEKELDNVINRKLLYVVYHTNKNYDVGALVRYMIKLFSVYQIVINFLLHGLKIITVETLMKQTDSPLETALSIACQDVQTEIFFGIHPRGFEAIFSVIPKNNNTWIMWQNDPHYFAHYVRDDNGQKVCVETYSKTYDPLFLSSDYFDYLLTPSLCYFKNLDITKYNHKLIDFFYILDPEHYKNISYDDYDQRCNQIILSGACSDGYTSRLKFLELGSTESFAKIIYYLKTPGYTDNEHLTEMNYYKQLIKFKGAFVGHHDFPLNFLLAKHIETLMCGCLGFFCKNPLLESQLGLKEFVHYIPCSDDQNNLITDPDYYLKWMQNGKDIARAGCEYIRNNFGESKILELINIFNQCHQKKYISSQ
jgi:hypothetical protein